MLAVGIFRFQLLDIVPVARNAIIESMSDGLMVVELHGGKIWMESQEGKGSTFGFSVPIARRDEIPMA